MHPLGRTVLCTCVGALWRACTGNWAFLSVHPPNPSSSSKKGGTGSTKGRQRTRRPHPTHTTHHGIRRPLSCASRCKHLSVVCLPFQGVWTLFPLTETKKYLVSPGALPSASSTHAPRIENLNTPLPLLTHTTTGAATEACIGLGRGLACPSGPPPSTQPTTCPALPWCGHISPTKPPCNPQCMRVHPARDIQGHATHRTPPPSPHKQPTHTPCVSLVPPSS